MLSISIIREWISFAANICILIITIYSFYLTFISKRIKFISITSSVSNSHGTGFSIVLENKSLSPVVIKDICLLVDNKFKVKMKKFDEPIIIEPYKAKKIISNRYSYTEPELPIFNGTNIVLEVKTSRKKIYLRIDKKSKKASKVMKSIPYNVTKITETFNNKIVPKNAKFVLIVFNEEWKKTLFVFSTGLMTEEVLGYNGLPEEVVKDEVSLIIYLDGWLKPNGIKYKVDTLKNYGNRG